MAQAEKMMLPKARLLVSDLFVRRAYEDPTTGEKGKPKYAVVIAWPVKDEEAVLQVLADAAYAEFGKEGEDAVFDGDIRLPLREGDDYVDERKAAGKSADGWGGTVYLRADSLYNSDGDEAEGGIYVCDKDAVQLYPGDKRLVYPGCYVLARVKAGFWKLTDKRDKKDFPFGYGMKLYLDAVQKVGDGDPLATGGEDRSSAFEPVKGKKTRRDAEREEDLGSRRGSSRRDRDEEPEEEDRGSRRGSSRRDRDEEPEEDHDDPAPEGRGRRGERGSRSAARRR